MKLAAIDADTVASIAGLPPRRSGKPSQGLKVCTIDLVEQLKRSCYRTQLKQMAS